MKRFLRTTNLALVCVLLCATVFAQTPTGTIRGTVTDQSGAVISGAAVTVTDAATGRTIDLKTTPEGIFVAPLLLPGDYTVKVVASGFAPLETKATVFAGQVANATARLQVGSTSQT